ncbi:MAG: hypothetical protein KIT84_38610 [Labilithrix sp.]|nr:hypothetical protein [Labilithrix sp.]MCW5816973.1 hypothetical protein [Labilithrix sp.]
MTPLYWGDIGVAIAGALLVVGAVLAYAARDARLHLREGIVVAPNARLLYGKHVAIDGVAPIPEGVRARILDEQGGFSRVHLSGATATCPRASSCRSRSGSSNAR